MCLCIVRSTLFLTLVRFTRDSKNSLSVDFYKKNENAIKMPCCVVNIRNSFSAILLRVIYDRVLNEKNNFEIPTFFMFERGQSRAGNSK